MQLAAGRILQAFMPQAEIAILTPFPEIDARTYASFRLQATSRRHPLRAMVLLLRAMLWRLGQRYGRMDVQRLRRAPELQALYEADVLVDLSGDTLTEDYGIKCFVSHLMPILTAVFLGRPVVLCAQTIGPFHRTRGLARWALNCVTLITTRETLSFDELRRLGVRRPALYLTADMAFLLPPAAPQRVRQILSAENVEMDSAPLVGIALSGLLGHRFSPGDPGQFEALMAALADDIIVRSGATVVLVAHVLGPGVARDDRLMARRVYNRIRHQGRAHQLTGDYRPEELKGVIGHCEVFLGLRMHANIAALGMGVPTLAIAYSSKTWGIMRMLGQERWACDLTGLTHGALWAQFEALWQQRQQVRRDLQAHLTEVNERARENARLIQDLIDTRMLGG
jgi:colanic acid/amylovoran biosynthesis protein